MHSIDPSAERKAIRNPTWTNVFIRVPWPGSWTSSGLGKRYGKEQEK